MNYQIKSAIFITLAYKNSNDIHSNPNQKTLFVALILSSEMFAGCTLFKICNLLQVIQFLDAGCIWLADCNLHTPGLNC